MLVSVLQREEVSGGSGGQWQKLSRTAATVTTRSDSECY